MSFFDTNRVNQALAREKGSSKMSHTVMVVDDEASNRFALTSALQSEYQVLQASDGMEALELARNYREPISVVISDQRMPRMSGTDLFGEMINIMPNTKRIILTGYMDINAIIESVNRANIYQFLVKPYDRQGLLLTVARAIESYEMELQLQSYQHGLEDEIKMRTKELEDKNREVLRRQTQLLAQRKVASLGAITTGVAQEIKSPLNFVNNFALLSNDMVKRLKEIFDSHMNHFGQDAREEVEDLLADLDQNCQRIHQHGDKMANIIDQVLTFSQGVSGEWQKRNVNRLVEKFAVIADQAMKNKTGLKADLIFDLGQEVGGIELIPQGISRVVVHLMFNAYEALKARAGENQSFEPTIRIRTRRSENQVRLIIEDNGEGVPSENATHIFEPFFTTRNSGQAGLGLAICREIANEHDGLLEVESSQEEFTRFTLTLPG